MSEYIIEFTDPNCTVVPVEHGGEIVRCGDCEHLNKLSREHEVYECYLTYMGVTLDGFCAWAERKEGGEC